MHVFKYKPLAGIWLCQLLLTVSWLSINMHINLFIEMNISIFCVFKLWLSLLWICKAINQSIDKSYQENFFVFNNKSLKIEYHNECFKDI